VAAQVSQQFFETSVNKLRGFGCLSVTTARSFLAADQVEGV